MSRSQTSTKSPTTVDAYVGARIRAARLERGLSQTELGGAAGITFQQIQKYERGANRVSMGRLSIISAAVGKPITFFMPEARSSKTKNANVNDVEVQFFASKYGMQVAQAFMKLPHEGQQALRDIAYLILSARE